MVEINSQESQIRYSIAETAPVVVGINSGESVRNTYRTLNVQFSTMPAVNTFKALMRCINKKHLQVQTGRNSLKEHQLTSQVPAKERFLPSATTRQA